MIITAKMNREFRACYSDERLKKLYGDGKTPREVGTLRTGAWADVSDADRCWILWQVIARENKSGMRECLARMLERVLPDGCDACSWSVIAVLRSDASADAADAANTTYAADAGAEKKAQITDILEFLS